MENVPSEAAIAAHVEAIKAGLNTLVQRACHSCAPSVGDYIVVSAEILTTLIVETDKLNKDVAELLDWRDSQMGDGR